MCGADFFPVSSSSSRSPRACHRPRRVRELLIDDAIYFQHAVIVRREWGPKHAGTVLVRPGLWRFTQVQLHPERLAANARALTDVRVRKALAHSLDKEAINQGIYEGESNSA